MLQRRSDSTRLEAFSDGVFAFAATLLVVSLEVPQSFEELLLDLSGFGAFALGFGALVMLWMVHHAYFRRYALEDGWTIALNACLLFVILFYVFPLKFVAAGLSGYVFGLGDLTRLPTIGSYDELATLFLLYSLGFVLIFTFVSLMYQHGTRRAQVLGLGPGELREAHFMKRHYALFVPVGLLSMLLAWLGVGVKIGMPGWVYAILGPVCWAHAAWSNRTRPAATL
jgi:uncharacterized membrane protein